MYYCSWETGFTSANKAEVMWSFFLCVCASFCQQDYWKSNEPISLKLDAMIGQISRKNWLTFGGATVPDSDFVSVFHFPHHCRIGHFRIFISISHTVTFQFYETWRNDWCWQGNESTTFCERSCRHPDPEIWIRIPNHFLLKMWHWRRFVLTEHSLSCLALFSGIAIQFPSYRSCY